MLKLKIDKELSKQVEFVKNVLTRDLIGVLYSINTPINDIIAGDIDDKMKGIDPLTEEQFTEMILANGLYQDWSTKIYGVDLGFNLVLSMRDMWLESVMREYVLRYKSNGQDPNRSVGSKILTNAKAAYQLNTFNSITHPKKFLNGMMALLAHSYGNKAGRLYAGYLAAGAAISAQSAILGGAAVAETAAIAAAPTLSLTAGGAGAIGATMSASTAVVATSGTTVISAGGAAAAGAGAAGATGAGIGATLLASPALPFIAAAVAAIGVAQIQKIMSVVAVLDHDRALEFDPSKSVYQSWLEGNLILNQVGDALASADKDAETEKSLTEADTPEETAQLKEAYALINQGKQQAASTNEVGEVTRSPQGRTVSASSISSDIHEEDK